jgi:hypothetical protein
MQWEIEDRLNLRDCWSPLFRIHAGLNKNIGIKMHSIISFSVVLYGFEDSYLS